MRDSEDRPVVAIRISELRRSRHISQLKASQNLGIPRSTYAGYESGQREPNLELLHKIAEDYQTTVDYLVGKTDDPNEGNADPYYNDMKVIMTRRLHWDGVLLTEEDKKPIIELLELVIRERLKYATLEKSVTPDNASTDIIVPEENDENE